jgi:hypothetical protein
MLATLMVACTAYRPPSGLGYEYDRARVAAVDTLPLVDVHVHYKWSQQEVTSPQQAVQTLQDNNIFAAVVIGTPAEYALELQRLAPRSIIPVWSPYRKPSDWSSWPYDRTVLQRARAALASGDYRGIGELHLIGGFAPPWQTPVISGLLELAGEYRVPVMLHTEINDSGYLIGICQAFPDTDILWAHAGAILDPPAVARVINTCPRVHVELSARDPWRFVNNPIAQRDGTLLPAWRSLIESYPERFMIGSDPVWPVDRLDSWDEPDSGWRQYRRFVEFHRHWLRELPADIAQQVGAGNALRLFRSGTGQEIGQGIHP